MRRGLRGCHLAFAWGVYDFILDESLLLSGMREGLTWHRSSVLFALHTLLLLHTQKEWEPLQANKRLTGVLNGNQPSTAYEDKTSGLFCGLVSMTDMLTHQMHIMAGGGKQPTFFCSWLLLRSLGTGFKGLCFPLHAFELRSELHWGRVLIHMVHMLLPLVWGLLSMELGAALLLEGIVVRHKRVGPLFRSQRWCMYPHGQDVGCHL